MARLAVGVSFSARRASRTSPELVPALADAFTAPSWQRPRRYYIDIVDAPKTPPRRPGMLKPKTLRAELGELLVSDALKWVSLQTSARNDEHFSRLGTQTHFRHHYEFARTDGYHYLDDTVMPVIDSWVADMLTFAERVGANHGVICVMNEDGASSESSLGGISRDGRDQHPYPDQRERMALKERALGVTYARFPRWGTLAGRAHVERIGGIEAIVSAVHPAVIRPLGEGVYVQLTETVATALSDESLGKQARFTELLAPLLPPPLD
jgi:hypothetical protein